jgi:hypothetical protein
MLVRVQVPAHLDVRRPVDLGWIQRPGDEEAIAGAFASRLNEQALEAGLSVSGIGAQVAQSAAERVGRTLDGSMQAGIDRPVQRRGPPGAPACTQLVQRGPTREAQVQVEFRDQVGREVASAIGDSQAVLGESRQRHRCIQVVEHLQRPG